MQNKVKIIKLLLIKKSFKVILISIFILNKKKVISKILIKIKM